MVDQPVQQAEQQPHFNVTTQSVPIQPLSEFSPNAEVGASLATKWKLWMEDFEVSILASGILQIRNGNVHCSCTLTNCDSSRPVPTQDNLPTNKNRPKKLLLSCRHQSEANVMITEETFLSVPIRRKIILSGNRPLVGDYAMKCFAIAPYIQ